MRTPLTFCTLCIILSGCSYAPETTHSQILPGARQDSDTEIPGKPEGATAGAEVPGVGYDQPGGEMSPNAAEQAATTQIHYHYHVHIHHPNGSTYEMAGLPTAAPPAGAQNGYASPQYATHVHHSGFNYYANPYSVPTSPYAHNPNDGNSRVPAAPYYSNVPGMHQPYGVGGYGYRSGGFNPFANDGSGAFGWSGSGQ